MYPTAPMETALVAFGLVAIHAAVLIPHSPVIPYPVAVAVLCGVAAAAAFIAYYYYFVADFKDFIERIGAGDAKAIVPFTLPAAFLSGAVANAKVGLMSGFIGTCLLIQVVVWVFGVEYGFNIRRYDAHCRSIGFPTFLNLCTKFGLFDVAIAFCAAAVFPTNSTTHYHLHFLYGCMTLMAFCITYPLLAHFVWRPQMNAEAQKSS